MKFIMRKQFRYRVILFVAFYENVPRVGHAERHSQPISLILAQSRSGVIGSDRE